MSTIIDQIVTSDQPPNHGENTFSQVATAAYSPEASTVSWAPGAANPDSGRMPWGPGAAPAESTAPQVAANPMNYVEFAAGHSAFSPATIGYGSGTGGDAARREPTHIDFGATASTAMSVADLSRTSGTTESFNNFMDAINSSHGLNNFQSINFEQNQPQRGYMG